MRKLNLLAAAAMLAGAGPAAAVNADGDEIPYFFGGGQFMLTDSKRDADDGLGYSFSLGVPLTDPRNAVELRFSDDVYARNSDGRDNLQSGLFVDYVRDFGALGFGGDFIGRIKPYAAAGLGLVQEDAKSEKTTHLGLSLGGGVMVPVTRRGIAVRLDARVQPQKNNETVPGENSLTDVLVSLGVQIPLAWFYDRPMGARAPGDECDVAVVDAEGGRSGCVIDSDQDGVNDTVDQCPGTSPGVKVDVTGCVRAPEDADRDGVLDSRDQCPGTPAGLKVNDTGCVVAQKSALSGVTFLPDSATLTEQGRQTLDGVAETLQRQENLKVEIAGHTDAIGSEPYNTLLSQQRADAVRAYLIEKGVEPDRMSAVGYGELEPVAGNDTDEGRRQNRRVEFRISTD